MMVFSFNGIITSEREIIFEYPDQSDLDFKDECSIFGQKAIVELPDGRRMEVAETFEQELILIDNTIPKNGVVIRKLSDLILQNRHWGSPARISIELKAKLC